MMKGGLTAGGAARQSDPLLAIPRSTMAGPRKRLGEILLDAGVIDQHQLQSALGHQKQWGGKLGRILVEKRFLTEDVMVKVLCRQLGMEAVDLNQQKIHERVIGVVPVEMASKFQRLPVGLNREAGGA